MYIPISLGLIRNITILPNVACPQATYKDMAKSPMDLSLPKNASLLLVNNPNSCHHEKVGDAWE